MLTYKEFELLNLFISYSSLAKLFTIEILVKLCCVLLSSSEDNFDDISLKTFDIKKYSEVLENAISNGTKIYNDAYISCANKAFGYDRKHDNHLALLDKIFNIDKAHLKILNAKTMEEAFNILKNYPLIGNFMAYQLVTDINYSDVVDWKEDEFTVAGPGSLRGIKKCFLDKGNMTNEDIIRYMYEHQDEEFKRLEKKYRLSHDRYLCHKVS